MRSITRHAATAAVILLIGCRGGGPAIRDVGETAPPSSTEDLRFEGQLVATEATELRAALNSFRVMGWHSYSSQIEIEELAEDGSRVQAGDVVARFEFHGARALPRIQQNIDEIQAEQKGHLLEVEAERKALQTRTVIEDLDAELAALDAQAVELLPRLEAELLALRAEILAFEAEASAQQSVALEREITAERATLEQQVARADAQLQRYQAYEERFLLRAPHDGVVRIAFSPRHKRKLRRGDGLPCGQPVLSIAGDERLSVDFHVPESGIAGLALGMVVEVSATEAPTIARAEVTAIDLFPREIAELKHNDQLPGGREKVLVVRADLTEPPGELRAGADVEVRTSAGSSGAAVAPLEVANLGDRRSRR